MWLVACKNDEKSISNKDTNKIEATDKQKKKSKTTPQVRIPSDGSVEVDLSHIQSLAQPELKPFLDRYQRDNNEANGKITTPYGDIEFMLYAGPKYHRTNFVRLTKLGYFDHTEFHRVAEGFVIQGGNSEKKVASQFRNKIGDFLIPNEFNPLHRHAYGTIAAAKYSEQNISKASSPFEFYIVVDPNGAHHLDEEHTVFGRVTKGMEVVEKISKVKVDGSEWPIENVSMKVEVF